MVSFTPIDPSSSPSGPTTHLLSPKIHMDLSDLTIIRDIPYIPESTLKSHRFDIYYAKLIQPDEKLPVVIHVHGNTGGKWGGGGGRCGKCAKCAKCGMVIVVVSGVCDVSRYFRLAPDSIHPMQNIYRYIFLVVGVQQSILVMNPFRSSGVS